MELTWTSLFVVAWLVCGVIAFIKVVDDVLVPWWSILPFCLLAGPILLMVVD